MRAKSTRWLEDTERFGDIRVEVVGESHYQPAIRAACDWKSGTDILFECMAELVPEPTNPYDRNAIKRQGSGACRAVIAGHASGDTDNLGVFLHLDAEVGCCDSPFE